MNTSAIMNVATTQQCGPYTNIPINTSAIMNFVIVYRRKCYVNIPMDASPMVNVLTTQLGTSCSFDSPGLARNEPTPGERSQGDATP